MVRYCASCGTEVDDTAVFCPTCGQPIDQDLETEMPAAPAWPEPEQHAPPREPAAPAAMASAAAPVAEPDELAATPPVEREPMRREAAAGDDEPAAVTEEDSTRVEARQVPPRAPGTAGPPPAAAADDRGARPAIDLPFTTPVTLSAWLIGVGSVVAALGALIGLLDSAGLVIDLLALIALIGIAATIFFATALPAIPHLLFITLAVVLVVFGVALDRLGVGRAGAGDLLLFLGAAAAVIGAVLLELGRDQPVGGPQS